MRSCRVSSSVQSFGSAAAGAAGFDVDAPPPGTDGGAAVAGAGRAGPAGAAGGDAVVGAAGSLAGAAGACPLGTAGCTGTGPLGADGALAAAAGTTAAACSCMPDRWTAGAGGACCGAGLGAGLPLRSTDGDVASGPLSTRAASRDSRGGCCGCRAQAGMVGAGACSKQS